jgi:glucan 1,3-beta-glucosidase
LHGAPGSQNGFDNSGYAGVINWTQPENVNRTIYDLSLIASKVVELNQQPETFGVVTGIELLNEPKTVAVGSLKIDV